MAAAKKKRFEFATVERRFTAVYAVAVLVFLVAPLLVIIPLSFNAEPYFSFTSKMLSLDPAGFSLRWYRDILENPQWLQAIANSLIIAISTPVPLFDQLRPRVEEKDKAAKYLADLRQRLQALAAGGYQNSLLGNYSVLTLREP